METPGGEALSLTPQEEQLLRRFFWRHALPYAVGLAAAVLLCGALALARSGPADAPELSGLRSELDRAVESLTAASSRLQHLEQSAEQTANSADALHRRLDSALQRVDVLENGVDETQKRVMDSVARLSAKPAAAASPDIDAMRERLDSVETRLFYFERALAGGGPEGPSPAPPASPD
jgi:septal ring factor EnvC (AmiA/AmiB activator)